MDECPGQTTTATACSTVTKSGSPCRAKPLQGQPFCIMHSSAELARELGRRGGKANIRVKPDPNPP
jgi:hypothetical protein